MTRSAEPPEQVARAKSSSERMPQLDILRGVAILLVLGSHPAIKADYAGPFLPLALGWHHVGWSGVDLFFVLSGFLIGGLLFAENRATGQLQVRRFLIRRAFKIWPPYYFYLLVLLVFCLRSDASPGLLLPFVVHVQNYSSQVEFLAPHTWTLAVEEHFYLALPVLLAFLAASIRPARVVVAFVTLGITCAVLRFWHGLPLPSGYTHLRIDSLAFGVVLAYLYHYHRPVFERISRYRVPLLVGGVVLVLAATLPGEKHAHWACCFVPTALFIGYGAVLTAMVSMPPRYFQSRNWCVFIFVGVYSYSIYLWHVDIPYRLIYALNESGRLGFLPDWLCWLMGMSAYVAASVGVGVLFGRCIEMPALALRDRLIPRKVSLDSSNARPRENLPIEFQAPEAFSHLAGGKTPAPEHQAAATAEG